MSKKNIETEICYLQLEKEKLEYQKWEMEQKYPKDAYSYYIHLRIEYFKKLENKHLNRLVLLEKRYPEAKFEHYVELTNKIKKITKQIEEYQSHLHNIKQEECNHLWVLDRQEENLAKAKCFYCGKEIVTSPNNILISGENIFTEAKKYLKK